MNIFDDVLGVEGRHANCLSRAMNLIVKSENAVLV